VPEQRRVGTWQSDVWLFLVKVAPVVQLNLLRGALGLGHGVRLMFEVDRGGSIDSHEGQYQSLESNASDYQEPVEVAVEGARFIH